MAGDLAVSTSVTEGPDLGRVAVEQPAIASRRWRLTHRPALDGLRGLAVLGVMAFHAQRLTGGYLGVDLFFVLSGFLITSLLLGERARSGSIALGAFWARRARRLLPALLLVLAVVAVAVSFLSPAADANAFRGDGLATLFYVANWKAIFASNNYWALFDAPSPLQHAWSLAIEEQFYVLWPLVVAAVLVWWRRSARAILAVALGGAAISVAAMVVASRDGDTTRAYFGTDTRMAAILLGAGLAAAFHLWGHVRTARSRLVLEIVAVVGVGWLAYAWVAVGGQDLFLYRGGFVLSELAALAIIAAATHERRGPVGAALSWRPLCWVGLVSYGLYLWHWPIFVFADEARVPLAGLALLGFKVALTFAVATASFYLVERPIRRGAMTTRTAAVAAPVAFAVTLLLVLAAPARPQASTVSSDDVAARLSAVASGSAAPSGGPQSGPQSDGSAAVAASGRVGARQALGRDPRVLVLGDSVAFTIAAGVIPYQQQLGVQTQSGAVIACGVARGDGRIKTPDGTIATESAACNDWANRWPATIASFQPDVVLLTLGWPGHTSRYVEGEWRQPCDPVFDRWYEGEVRAAIDVLARQQVPLAMTTAAYYRSPRAPAGTDAKTDCLNSLYRRVAADQGVRIIDLAGWVCPDGQCREQQDGVVLRPDGLHFDGPAGVIAGAWVLDELLTPMAAGR
ncbi:MAG: acyltransferase [Actinobacteria bacterium]|nr:acyltransferase [Actinomycetota bacterium]